MAPLIGAMIPVIGSLLDKLIPDKEAAAKAKQQLAELEQQGALTELQTVASIIVAEAKSESWLTRSWRPITMLWMMALLTLWMFGLSPPNVDPYIDSFFRLLTVGIGGYVVGRSGMQVAQAWKNGKK